MPTSDSAPFFLPVWPPTWPLLFVADRAAVYTPIDVWLPKRGIHSNNANNTGPTRVPWVPTCATLDVRGPQNWPRALREGNSRNRSHPNSTPDDLQFRQGRPKQPPRDAAIRPSQPLLDSRNSSIGVGRFILISLWSTYEHACFIGQIIVLSSGRTLKIFHFVTIVSIASCIVSYNRIWGLWKSSQNFTCQLIAQKSEAVAFRTFLLDRHRESNKLD